MRPSTLHPTGDENQHGWRANSLNRCACRTTPTLLSISLDALSTIVGGCGKKCGCSPPTRPHEGAPAAPAPGGPRVPTNVSVTSHGAPAGQTVAQ